MAEPLETNSLELRIAFHHAVSRFQDWTANVAEPKVKFRGRFCPISEVCEQVANLSNPLPKFILSVLYKETKASDDVLALKFRADQLTRDRPGVGRMDARVSFLGRPETCRWATPDEMRRFGLKDRPMVHLDASGEIDCYFTETGATVVHGTSHH